MKKIVIFYLFDDTGHHRACQALERAFALTSDDVEIRVVHALRCLSPRISRRLESCYFAVLKSAPFLWNLLYDRASTARLVSALKRFILKRAAPAFKKVMDELKPDAVICTQALPAILVSDYKRRQNLDLPLFAVLTDFHPHSYWIEQGITSYVVPSEEAARTLVGRGVDARKIQPIGIPVDPAFCRREPENQEERPERSRSAFSDVLIMGGSRGFLSVEPLLRQLNGLSCPFHVTVITGKNEKLRNRIEKAAFGLPRRISVRGYVSDVHMHLRAARLFITKGGGVSLAEAIACGVPTVLLKSLPGQEDHNARALADEPNVFIAESPRQAARLAENILTRSGARPEAGLRGAASTGSALRIARFIREKI